MTTRHFRMSKHKSKGSHPQTRRPAWQVLIGAFVTLSLIPLAAWFATSQSQAKPRTAAAAETQVAAQPFATPSPSADPTHATATSAARSKARTYAPKTKSSRVLSSPAKTAATRKTTSPATANVAYTTTATSSARAHFTVNLKGSYSAAVAAGFNVFDVAGSQTNPAGLKTKLNALPAGTKAMIWVGNLDNSSSTPGFTLAQFKAQVDALKSDPRVYGYFISDEAHPGKFPLAATHIRERADYLRSVAPAQKSFIVVLDGTSVCGGTLGCEYAALAPSKTHVDLVGIDSYPCHLGAACDYAKITERVNVAAQMGIPKSQMVPVYQGFGQEGKASGAYYRTPTPTELSTMLSTWKAALPNAVLDYAYTWGTQTTAPQALANHPSLASVVKSYNGR